ncbi:hypothetical protein OG735_41335 (plasmid) [Streptomyces sp. NBC_01210]|uniref:hypothetical protein n=1 Tax=Streptomyces sp. NBC_01210 TaxID=2903774 RepID=UPI002E0F220A|nr:hypothetical protein OG735_41335 [Streptomyces sp. NBC_01210]
MTDKRHLVTDAHGRSLDLTNSQAPAVPWATHHQTRTRRRRTGVAVSIAAVLAGGLVLSVLLIVIRDIATTVASTSVTGLLLRALLTSSGKRER